jgi:hypothetical protein
MEIKLEVALVAAHVEGLVVGYKPSSWPECYHKAFARFRRADNVRPQKTEQKKLPPPPKKLEAPKQQLPPPKKARQEMDDDIPF